MKQLYYDYSLCSLNSYECSFRVGYLGIYNLYDVTVHYYWSHHANRMFCPILKYIMFQNKLRLPIKKLLSVILFDLIGQLLKILNLHKNVNWSLKLIPVNCIPTGLFNIDRRNYPSKSEQERRYRPLNCIETNPKEKLTWKRKKRTLRPVYRKVR